MPDSNLPSISKYIPTNISTESVSDFFETVLTHAPSSPEKDYRKLCEAWRKASGADWIWLWLIHTPRGAPSAMQLVARSQRTVNMPALTHMQNPRSIAAYCARTGKIEVVDGDFKKWIKTIDSEIYTAALANELESMGCTTLACVPLHMPPLSPRGRQKAPEHMPIICGAVCLHYKRPVTIEQQAISQLRTMGQLSAQALLNSYQALQRTILIKLDKIAHRYLTDRDRDLEATCRRYTSEVIAIIKSHLQVKGISLFYRDSLRGGVQCLATTGLAWVDGRRVENPAEVHYNANEGRTGICYSSGRPLILIDGLDHKKPPKTAELIDNEIQLALPATLFPIPFPEEIGQLRSSPQALGVIRCKFHHSDLMEGTGLSFDSIELQTLDFISQQIAPVLETMELNIARERVVSVTKHDLNAPIGTIRHKTFELRINKDIRLDKDYIAVNRYDIYDIAVCTMMCVNLVTQLDADPYSFIPSAKPEQLSLESRVMAPLKNMLAHFASEQNNMRIYFSGFDRFPDLWLDGSLLQRVVFNLITNAVKYGLEGTQVDISARIEPAYYYIDISNEGPGIEADEVEKIFMPKFRSPRTEKMAFGLGLGLPIARACLEKCGCELILSSRRDPTIFSIRIPIRLLQPPSHITA